MLQMYTFFNETPLIVFACNISTDERKKAKQSYQESLQNVPTVREQAAVSHVLFCAYISPHPL